MVVLVPPSASELVADRLWSFAPVAIEERDAPEGTLLLAGFGRHDQALAAAAAVDELLAGFPGGERARLVPVEDDGLDGWRAWARVEHAAPFAIVPTWLPDPTPRRGVQVLRIDPGHTFGSGSHPTTRLVLSRLASLVAPGASVLDVGCGSGVLAVGAALLGAGRVHAIDVDPDSPAATAANADRNGVGPQVHASNRSLAQVVADGGRFDVVAANLLAPVIVELATNLVAAVAPGGALVVSGLLAERWEQAATSLVGLTVDHVDTADDWVAVTLRPSR